MSEGAKGEYMKAGRETYFYERLFLDRLSDVLLRFDAEITPNQDQSGEVDSFIFKIGSKEIILNDCRITTKNVFDCSCKLVELKFEDGNKNTEK